MAKRKFVHIIICFLAAWYFLAAGVPSVPVSTPDAAQPAAVTVKSKEDKCIKPFSKIKKIKLKVRYKASEIKFALGTFYISKAPLVLFTKSVAVNPQYHLSTGVHFRKKQRGPPAVV